MPDQAINKFFLEYDRRKENMDQEESKFDSSFEKLDHHNPLN